MKPIVVILSVLVASAAMLVSYDADGGWLFNRQRCEPGGQCPTDVSFPIDEIPIGGLVTLPTDRPVVGPPIDPPTTTVTPPTDRYNDLAERVESLEEIVAANREPGHIDIDVVVQAVLARLPKPQPAVTPDINTIVGEVLSQLPPRVAYYEIVPRNSK